MTDLPIGGSAGRLDGNAKPGWDSPGEGPRVMIDSLVVSGVPAKFGPIIFVPNGRSTNPESNPGPLDGGDLHIAVHAERVRPWSELSAVTEINREVNDCVAREAWQVVVDKRRRASQSHTEDRNLLGVEGASHEVERATRKVTGPAKVHYWVEIKVPRRYFDVLGLAESDLTNADQVLSKIEHKIGLGRSETSLQPDSGLSRRPEARVKVLDPGIRSSEVVRNWLIGMFNRLVQNSSEDSDQRVHPIGHRMNTIALSYVKLEMTTHPYLDDGCALTPIEWTLETPIV